MKLAWPALLLLFTLAGCGAVDTVKDGFSSLVGSEDDPNEAEAEAIKKRLEPVDLVDFDASLTVTEQWSVAVGSGTDDHYLKLHPVEADGRVYAAEFDGDVIGFTLGGGKQLWSTDTDTAVTGGPGVGDGIVVVGSKDGEVTALASDRGVVLWRAQVTSEVLAEPVASSGVVVVRCADGKVFGLDASDGSRRWSYDRLVPTLSLRGYSAPVVSGDLVMIGFDNGRIVALDLLAGKPVWEANVAVPRGRTDLDRIVDIDGDLTVADGVLYVVSYQGRLAAIDISTGEGLWGRDLSSYSGVAVSSDRVYVSDDAGGVWCMDRLDGSAIWKQEGLANRQTSAPAVVGDYIVVGDYEGYVHWLNASDGSFAARERADSSPVIAAPLVVGDQILVYTAGGDISSYRPAAP
jgi:outer membrane protein assembly factor BamB